MRSPLSQDRLPAYLADRGRKLFSLILTLAPGGELAFVWRSLSVAQDERPRAGAKFSCESSDVEVRGVRQSCPRSFTVLREAGGPARGT